MFRIEDRAAAVLSWLHGVLLFSAVYLLIACAPFLEEDKARIFYLRSLWLLIPMVISWFAVRRIKGLILYLLTGAIVTAVLWGISGCIITSVLSAVLFLIRTYPRFVKGKMIDDMPGEAIKIEIWEIPTFLDKPQVVYCSVFLIVYFVAIFAKRHMLLPTIFYILMAEIFVIYIHASIVRMKSFILNNRRIANLPVRTMQIMQRAVLAVTLLLLLLFILPSVFYGKEPLTRISEWKIERTGAVEVELESEQQAKENDSMEAMQELFGAEEQQEMPQWAQQLFEILFYLIFASGVTAVLICLYRYLRRMMQNFANGQGEDEIILLGTDETELLSGKRKSKGWGLARTPQMKIRKAYKKLIRKNLKEQPSGSETPSDLEKKAGLQDTVLLHSLYEKARYSKEQCTKEEAESFLKL